MTGILNISRWHMRRFSLVEKKDLHKFYSRQIYRKIVTKLRSKCEANPNLFLIYNPMFWYVNILRIYHLCPTFSPQFLVCCLFVCLFVFCEIFSARRKFGNKLGWARTIPTLVPLIGLILIFRRASPSLLYGSPNPPGKISPLENFVHAHNR